MLTENIKLADLTPQDLADAIAMVEIALDQRQPARDRVAAATYIANRIDGTPRQSLDVSRSALVQVI